MLLCVKTSKKCSIFCKWTIRGRRIGRLRLGPGWVVRGVTSVDRLNRILEMGLATRREGSLVKLKGRRMEGGKLVVATK